VPEPGDLARAHHPPAGRGQQRAGQQDQAEREHADPARAVHGEADVVRDQPQHGGGAQHPGQAGADADVRRGDPADRGEGRQHGEPAGRGRAGGDAARDDQRPGGTRPGPGALRGGRGIRVVRIASRRCFGANTHKPMVATIGPGPKQARRLAAR
jgi:hypothetical protein